MSRIGQPKNKRANLFAQLFAHVDAGKRYATERFEALTNMLDNGRPE
jgi:hypothetical protein